MATSCEHWGKSSEELAADMGMAWILEHCPKCLSESSCKAKANRMDEDKQAERDERLLKLIAEVERLDREYKEATIKLSKQLPTLIDELILLRGAINRRS